jgi:hypothetical protein
MHRLIARSLLLVALVGNFAPLALAATAAPRACCIRKTVHHCHDSLGHDSLASAPISDSGQLVIRDVGTCNHDCCRAVPTDRWAQAQPPAAASFVRHVEAYLGQSNPVFPNAGLFRFQSTRAPPVC